MEVDSPCPRDLVYGMLGVSLTAVNLLVRRRHLAYARGGCSE